MAFLPPILPPSPQTDAHAYRNRTPQPHSHKDAHIYPNTIGHRNQDPDTDYDIVD